MPSVGRIKQLAVLGGVTAGLLAVGTSSASAAPNQVWLWACHGPAGQPLSTSIERTQNAQATVTGDCSGADGLTFSLPSDGTNIPSEANASVVFPTIPGNTLMSQVLVNRSFSGFGQAGASNQLAWNVANNVAPFETAPVSAAAPAGNPLDATVTEDKALANGDQLRMSLRCASNPNSPCAGTAPASVKVVAAAIRISEAADNKVADDATTAPAIAVGGKNSPTSETMKLDIRATDRGVGLSYAEAYFANAANTAVVGPRVTKSFIDTDAAYAACKDLTPDTPTVVDLPLGAVCPTVANVTIDYPTRSVPNGVYTLIVRVVDVTGRETIFKDGANYPQVEVANDPNLGQSSQQLSIGTSGIANQPGGSNNPGGSGGVAGATATQCSSPRLSVELAQKPMRVTKGTPVLEKNKRYAFKGRLTCVVNGKRQSAPKRARIDLQNKVGKKTTDVSGTTVASKGAFRIILSYSSSRTLIFSFTNSEGKSTKVNLKIKVEKKKKSKR